MTAGVTRGEAVWLIAFGDLESFAGATHRRTSANDIFDALLPKFVWYLPRKAVGMAAGDTVVLYQNSRGVRAFATIDAVESTTTMDPHLRSILGSTSAFAAEIRFRSIERLSREVSLKPLVNQLEFISNKVYWGQSLRSTPRRISRGDFGTIVRASKITPPTNG